MTVGAFVSSSLSLSALISLQLTPCFLPCDDVMAFICCGVPIDSLSLLPTPHTSYFYPAFLQSPILYLYFPLPQILLLLKRRWGDLEMLGCCFAHPRNMFDTQIGMASASQILLQFLFTYYWFNVSLYSYITHSCDYFLSLTSFFFPACSVQHTASALIINPLIAWCHSARAYDDSGKGNHFSFLLSFILERLLCLLAELWVRNLFQFKQDALIAEAHSQIIFIHPRENCLMATKS